MLELWTKRTVLFLMALTMITYLADLAAFQLRHQPHDTIACPQVVAIPLKNNRTEYDYQGSVNLDCARALFPRNGLEACWYLRHKARQLMNF